MATNALECKYFLKVGEGEPKKYLLEKIELKCNLMLCYWNYVVSGIGKFSCCIKDVMLCFFKTLCKCAVRCFC